MANWARAIGCGVIGGLVWCTASASYGQSSGTADAEAGLEAPALPEMPEMPEMIAGRPVVPVASQPSGGRWFARAHQYWTGRVKPSLQYSHWGYLEQFEEPPFGASVRVCQQAQVCNGLASRMVLYHTDFCENGASLSPHGYRRLRDIANTLPPHWCHVLRIEPATGPMRPDLPPDQEVLRRATLNQERRAHVQQVLNSWGIAAQVEIGGPDRPWMRGEEALIHHGKYLHYLQSGLLGGGGGGGSGAANDEEGEGS